MEAIGILLCGGVSSRMGFDKLTTPLGGMTAMERSAVLLRDGGATRLIVAVNGQTRAFAEKLNWPLPVTFCDGGQERRNSVQNALLACNANDEDIVLIHDADRCFMPASVVRACLNKAVETGSGVAALKVADTVLSVREEEIMPLNRDFLWRTQTPQCFQYGEIMTAYAVRRMGRATDDATLYAAQFDKLTLVEGSEDGRKLTTPLDWEWAVKKVSRPRFGTGYDTHILTENRRLILGGVEIPFEKGLLGHSDADVLLHAIMDALLGAAAMGDIGKNFPDKDPSYKDISSRVLLRQVGDKLRKAGLTISHIDATVIAQRPKLNPHFAAMIENIAEDLGLSPEQVSLKATTTEGMHDEGRGLCITALANAVVVG